MNPKQQFVVVDDVSAPFQFDFVVTLEDILVGFTKEVVKNIF